VLEDPTAKTRGLKLKKIPNLRCTQYTHGGGSGPERPVTQHIIEVVTDEGIVGRCTTTMRTDQVYFLKEHVVGKVRLNGKGFTRCFTRGRAGCIKIRGGLEILTIACGILLARQPSYTGPMWNSMDRAATSAWYTPIWAAVSTIGLL